MSQQPKRSMREHRSPKYLHLQESELNNNGYSFNSSAKMFAFMGRQNRSTKLSSKEAGKLLANFLNGINQRLRDQNSRANTQGLKFGLGQKQPEQKLYINKNSQNIKTTNPHKTTITPKTFKEHKHQNTKTKENGSNSKSQQLNANTLQSQQIKKSLLNINAISPAILSKMVTPSLAVLQQQMLLQKSFFQDKQIKKQSNIMIGNQMNNNMKFFKRSAYHVAIAYHIHLKKLNTQGYLKDVDPTSQAKKIMEITNNQFKSNATPQSQKQAKLTNKITNQQKNTDNSIILGKQVQDPSDPTHCQL